MNNEFLELTLESLQQALRNLAKALPPNACLYPIPRGGVIVACMLKYHRDDIKIHNIQELTFGAIPLATLDGTDVIIDDIVDTGKTLKPYHDAGIKIMTLWGRDSITAKRSWNPTFVSAIIISKAYFILPWEGNLQAEKEKYLKRIGEKDNE